MGTSRLPNHFQQPQFDVDEADVYHYCKVSTLKIWEESNFKPVLKKDFIHEFIDHLQL